MALSSQTRAAWTRRLIAGAARGGAAPDSLDPRAALALLGARARFERPSLSEPAEIEPAVEDRRSILPGAARPPLRRLLRQKTGAMPGQTLVWAAFLALGARSFRLDPFDLPLAEPWLRQPWAPVGPTERAFLARLSPGKPTLAVLGWNETPSAERYRAVRERRVADPDEGRAFVRAQLPGLQAPARADFVQALELGLGEADRSLLGELAGDRARGVSEAAKALLARLPGSAAYAERLAAARQRLTLKKAGLLGGKRRLELAAPPKATRDPSMEAIALAQWLRLSDLAAQLSSTPNDLIGAAEAPLPALVVATAALCEGRADALDRLAGPLAAYGPAWFATQLAGPLGAMPPAARRLALERYVEAAPPTELVHSAYAGALLEHLEGPLSLAAARAMLRSPGAERALEELGDKAKARVALDRLISLAALVPRAATPELAAILDRAGGAATGPARDLIQFLQALPDEPDR
jgi:hypothetical protein